VKDGVDGANHPVGPFGGIAGEVRQLTEDDVDSDGIDEPDHHRVRHEPQDRPEPEQPRGKHHNASQHRQSEQGPRRVDGSVNGGHVRNDHRHRTGALDRHERRTGHDGAGDRPHHVGV
jgi:hypothetical protein